MSAYLRISFYGGCALLEAYASKNSVSTVFFAYGDNGVLLLLFSFVAFVGDFFFSLCLAVIGKKVKLLDLSFLLPFRLPYQIIYADIYSSYQKISVDNSVVKRYGGISDFLGGGGVPFKVFGVGAKIFAIAGPVILYGLTAGVVYGFIYYFAGI